MAWNVDQIYGFLRWLINKNQAGGVSATDFFYVWNSEQYSYQQDLLGRWQNRTNTKEGINTGLIENETIMLKLAPFTKGVTIAVVGGQAPKPADFAYALALRINNAKVFSVDHDMLWAVLDDVIDPPSVTANSYYYIEYLNYYQLYPGSVTTLDLDYIGNCTDVVWGFTLDPTTKRQVYSPGASSQPMWGQNSIIEITKRALKSLGVHFSAQDFEAFGSSNIVTGN